MRYSRVFPIVMQHCSTYKNFLSTNKNMWIFGKLKVLSNVRQQRDEILCLFHLFLEDTYFRKIPTLLLQKVYYMPEKAALIVLLESIFQLSTQCHVDPYRGCCLMLDYQVFLNEYATMQYRVSQHDWNELIKYLQAKRATFFQKYG